MTNGRMIDSAASASSHSVVSPPMRQNVTFAVNYSSVGVDQLVKPHRSPPPSVVVGVPLGTFRQTNMTNKAAALQHRDVNSKKSIVHPAMTKISFSDNASNAVETNEKRPSREAKPQNMEKDKVKYDMNLVPGARRNKEFVRVNGPAWHTNSKGEESRLVQRNRGAQKEAAFTDNAGVVWIPKNRSEWEDCVSEMTAVCTASAMRRYVVSKSVHKAFHAPLSKDYIRDRVDIDDPLEGFQIRHKGGGWLQGFILWTNFTTWTHFFKFDSLHPESGVSKTDTRFKVDFDGSLAEELESQPRSGDPLGAGVVYENMAEISLLGGLGCGEYLLRMALDDIASRGRYKYVVLQATDSSRSFYEKFGFQRVGAVSTYGNEEHLIGNEDNIVGYRHWTYAHETSTSLDLHGGPSYMMAVRLPPNKGLRTVGKPSFLSEMKKLEVNEKPKIMNLGGASTPARKKKTVRPSLASPAPNPYLKHVTTPGRDRRKRSLGTAVGQVEKGTHAENKMVPVNSMRSNKKSKTATSNLSVVETRQTETLLTPPPESKTLTYAQKQYQSVWLAVPPAETAGSAGGRKPPRRRDSTPLPANKKNENVSSASAGSVVAGKNEKVVETRRAPCRKSPRRPGTTSTGVAVKPADTQKPAPRSGTKRGLRKQRVETVRDPNKVYYYNKVLKQKDGKGGYFFVLHYNEAKATVRLLPLYRSGELVGKRQGRPRYKADTANPTKEVPVSAYEIVPAYMVTKTAIVVNETWDIL